MPLARKDVPEMLGETLREAAVLVLVFGFLDAFFSREQLKLDGFRVWAIALWVLGISFALWWIGAVFERKRPDQETGQ